MANVAVEPAGKPGGPLSGFDLQKITSSPAFVPGLVVLGAIVALFFPLFKDLPTLYQSPDGYYSHGWLVPLISGYIIYRWWPRMKDTPVKPFFPALLLMIAMGWILFAGIRGDQNQVQSLSFVAMLASGVWFVAGGRWLLWLSVPILYLLFGLPIWTAVIDNYTNPLQQISTEISYAMLQMFGLNPLKDGAVMIMLDNFVLDVGVPCSGLKLLIAVTAFMVLFVCIANLKWWGNLGMVLMVVPLCLFINGLRIALIGVVGNAYGPEAGHQFHDSSGFITLVICFVMLFGLARALGWKD